MRLEQTERQLPPLDQYRVPTPLLLGLVLKSAHVLMQFLLVQLPSVSKPPSVRLDSARLWICGDLPHLLQVRLVSVHIQSFDSRFGAEKPFSFVFVGSVRVV